MTSRERAENLFEAIFDSSGTDDSLTLIESAILEAEAEGWKRGIKEAAWLISRAKMLTYHHDQGAAAEAVKLNDDCERFLAATIEKKEKA